MAVVEELLREEADGTISFGNHTLADKAKVEDFSHDGDLYKVKTFQTMTKLEKNGMFLYESVPGTSVTYFDEKEDGVSFIVDGDNDAQLTIGLAENTEYQVWIGDENMGTLKSNLSGKMNISVALADASELKVQIKK